MKEAKTNLRLKKHLYRVKYLNLVSMSIAFVECPNCHFRFNYRFNRAFSLHASLGNNERMFFCPNCDTRQKFDLTIRKLDDAHETYDDRLNLWEITILIGPVVPLLALLLFDISYGLGIFREPTMIALPLGIFMWIFAITLYSSLKTPLRGAGKSL